MDASKPAEWLFAGGHVRCIISVGTFLADRLTVTTNKRNITLYPGTLNPRLLLVALFVLATGQVNAQNSLRATGAPVLIAGDEGAYFMNPRWAPSGDRIAFTGAEYKGLWLSDPDGGNRNLLTDEASAGFGFSWSADGTALVTRVARYEGS